MNDRASGYRSRIYERYPLRFQGAAATFCALRLSSPAGRSYYPRCNDLTHGLGINLNALSRLLAPARLTAIETRERGRVPWD